MTKPQTSPARSNSHSRASQRRLTVIASAPHKVTEGQVDNGGQEPAFRPMTTRSLRRKSRKLIPSPCSSGLRLAVFFVPYTRALRAQFHDLVSKPPYSFRTSRTIAELRPLRGVVREEHLGFALSHPPERGRESTSVRSIYLLAERPGTRALEVAAAHLG